MSRWVVLLLAVTVVVVATDAAPAVPKWERGPVADARHELRIRVGFAQNNLDALKERVLAVSDPHSPSYGQWLTLADVRDDFVGQPVSVLDNVTTTIVQAGGRDVEIHPTHDFVTFTATVAQARRLFFDDEQVAFHEYRHGARRQVVRASKRPTRMLHPRVDYVEGVADLPVVPERFARVLRDDPGIHVEPPVLAAKYKIPAGPVPVAGNASQAVAEFEQAQFLQSDVTLFQKKWNYTRRAVDVVGPNNGGYYGEASLDVQYILPASDGVLTFDYACDQFDILCWSALVLKTPQPPLVHSISWGSGESSYEADQRSKWTNEFLKLASMGFSILCASGDQGTGHQGLFSCGKFDPTFPASSPWVTAVGGTYTSTDAPGSETCWGMSGGGFSAYFERPAYQKAAADAYLASGVSLPSSSYFNASGRAIPDVSALSTNYVSIVEGYSGGTISGTSAATPLWAGFISRLNAERHMAGKKPLGFLNPWLYSSFGDSSPGFDVTAGSNPSSPCPKGFSAAKGFDPCSGLGTPSWPTLSAANN